jgi:hypothetical protein
MDVIENVSPAAYLIGILVLLVLFSLIGSMMRRDRYDDDDDRYDYADNDRYNDRYDDRRRDRRHVTNIYIGGRDRRDNRGGETSFWATVFVVFLLGWLMMSYFPSQNNKTKKTANESNPEQTTEGTGRHNQPGHNMPATPARKPNKALEDAFQPKSLD